MKNGVELRFTDVASELGSWLGWGRASIYDVHRVTVGSLHWSMLLI